MTAPQSHEKAVRLVQYLLKLASLRTKLIRDIDDYERTLWISDIPNENGCFTQAWGRDDDYDADVWIQIQNRQEPHLPSVPDQCKDWVTHEALRNKHDIPELLPQISKDFPNPVWREGTGQPKSITRTQRLVEHPEVQNAWDRYVEQRWLPWVDEHNVWQSIHKVYSSLFAIHQEQLRLGEEYELVVALGLLTWQTPSGQRVRRHLIVANALIQFESRLAKFTVRPMPDGANLRPELDMLEIEEQPPRAEEAAKASLLNAKEKDDPWDNDCIKGVLQGLVHSMQGEYDDALQSSNVRASVKPLVEYAPALVMRKRSAKGLTDVLNRIKERIETGEDVPDEFSDLAEIRPAIDPEFGDDSDPLKNSFDGEVFFPKPSNEEQRRIVDKFRRANAVLVQGPPGTGKSHTIANLIGHLLATGQRTLITAKTPRALRVLEELVPESLRPLCINLLGSGLEEKRSLESSVGGILREKELWNHNRAAEQSKELERTLCGLREEKSRVDRRLRDIRESETHVQSIADGTYRGTAARIAEAVNRDSTTYGWFTDTVLWDKACPISETELQRVLSALRYFTPEKRQELGLACPDTLPSRETLADFVERERTATEQERVSQSGADERISNQLLSGDVSAIRSLMNELSAFESEFRALAALSYPWMKGALRDVVVGNASLWRELSRVTHEAVASIESLIPVADDAVIVFPNDVSPKALYQDSLTLKDHLRNGGWLGFGPFRPKAVKECINVLKHVRLNGRSCTGLEHFSILADALKVRLEFEKASEFWGGRDEPTQGPFALQLQALNARTLALDAVLSLPTRIEQCRNALTHCAQAPAPDWSENSQLVVYIASCNLALARVTKRRVTEQIASIEVQLANAASKSNAHLVVSSLLAAIRCRDVAAWANAIDECKRLQKDRQSIQNLDKYVTHLRHELPRLTEQMERTCSDAAWEARIPQIQGAWRWAQARYWIETYIREEDAPSLAERTRQVERQINDTITALASLHAWTFCLSRLTDNHQRHMEAWCKHVKALSKSGTGKRDFRNRTAAQRSLNECKDAVPAWVMPLHRVWDTIEPAPGIFDVVIVDEASQCGFEALPLLYLAKKILIVGDDKQISPSGAFQEVSAIHKLMDEFLHDFKFKEFFDVNTSLFDHGKLRFASRRIILREHFRCMPEIIRFSNDLCYCDTPLIPLRQYGAERLAPLEHEFVAGGYREGNGDRVVNRPEAAALVEAIVQKCQDPRYKDKTMGVVVLQGEAQGRLIEDELLERLGAEEMDRRRLICGNPYSFQGDERDIMFLSMVAATNAPIGPFVDAAAERRFNVAASRARDQMILFHSVTCEDLSATCLRRRLLEFFENSTPQDIPGTAIDRDELERRGAHDNRGVMKPPRPFESWFEVDVALEMMRRGYDVRPQHDVAGRRIDLVVEGGQARLAVECDGDVWHGPDRYDADMERQRQLERCGWHFFRVRESAYYSNSQTALRGLWPALGERGIWPRLATKKWEPQTSGRNDTTAASCGENGIIRAAEAHEASERTKRAIKVCVGCTVVYIDQEDGTECEAMITTDSSNPQWGLLNANTPVAKALIGAQIGAVVVAHLPSGIARLKITDIR